MTSISIQHYPEREVGGIRGWFWPNVDVQTWDIIKHDWDTSHRKNILMMMTAAKKQFRTVIQAGGNCGMYPRLLSTMFQRVYTYEPDPINFAALTMNCMQENIFKLQAALGESNGHVSMVRRTWDNVGMHQVEKKDDSWIPCLTLDTLPHKEVDLIMLDIEDYEMEALAGAYETIAKNRPLIFLENPKPDIDKHLDLTHGYQKIGQSVMDGIYYHEKLF